MRQLAGFRRVHLALGASTVARLTIAAEQLRMIDPQGEAKFVPGQVLLSVGDSQPDALSQRLMGRAPVQTTVTLR